MAVGLIIRNDSGGVILDATKRAGRFLGSFSTNGEMFGSFTDTRLIGFSFFNIGVGYLKATANSSTGVVTWRYDVEVTGNDNMPGPETRMHTVYYGAY